MAKAKENPGELNDSQVQDQQSSENIVYDVTGRIKDECFWGIQAFDNPCDVFGVMSDLWGEGAVEYQEHLYVLDDKTFENVLLHRALECLCKEHFGIITKEECEQNLGISDDITDYLLDFNYIHYSEKSGRYYASRMEMKDDNNHVWNKRQWYIFDELREIHDFDSIVTKARDFFITHQEEIDDYGPDDYYYVLNDNGLYCFV